ncbi:MAG: DUF2934 domain-containing protein [Gammaproteobacteria bacterium]|nr:DUF2934 domain-containing protein [Gammaproteobacteria bacterium]
MPEQTKSTVAQKSSKGSRKAPPAGTEAASIPTPKATRAASKTSKALPAAPITTSEERHRLIAETAYYLAERRGFQGSNPDQDWFEAASQVDKLFMAGT